jgi:LppP/LprE lipoprotein
VSLPRRRSPFAPPPAAFLALLALAGCGGGTRATGDVTPATVTQTVTAPATTSTGSGTSAGSGAATGTTPAPPPNPNAPLSLHAAEQTLDARGFATLTERDFRPGQRLKVLVGVRRGSADARTQQAFFFVGDRFIGTDTADTSAGISVVDQGDDHVTLDYALYKPSDALCCPSAGSAQVTYRWDGTRLLPQGAIPPSASGAAASRR